jgi:Leucine-rich repeat (LRR) protein
VLTLNLSYNQLRKVPESICSFQNMTKLILDANLITKILDCIGDLPKLEYFHASTNR